MKREYFHYLSFHAGKKLNYWEEVRRYILEL